MVSTKTIVFAFALLVLAPDALAQVTLRDRDGRVIERIDPLYPGADTWIRRGRDGQRLGTVERTPYGDYVVRDRHGRRTGKVERK